MGKRKRPTPDEALRLLKEGNERRVNGHPTHADMSHEWRLRLTEGQYPFATILGCSDSRVPLELVFDQGLGDLFVLRIAGNAIGAEILGTIQFAAKYLRTPLFMVLGHTGCGAVTAAVDKMLGKGNEQPKHIKALLKSIAPALKDLDPKTPRKKLIAEAVAANVRWSMQQIARVPEARKSLKEKRAALVGAVYDLESGRVSFL